MIGTEMRMLVVRTVPSWFVAAARMNTNDWVAPIATAPKIVGTVPTATDWGTVWLNDLNVVSGDTSNQALVAYPCGFTVVFIETHANVQPPMKPPVWVSSGSPPVWNRMELPDVVPPPFDAIAVTTYVMNSDTGIDADMATAAEPAPMFWVGVFWTTGGPSDVPLGVTVYWNHALVGLAFGLTVAFNVIVGPISGCVVVTVGGRSVVNLTMVPRMGPLKAFAATAR